MKSHNKKNNIFQYSQKGFTLVETMIAVFILTLTLSTLLGITASNIFSSRYAKNEIIANYLLEEAVDSIRNDRDSVAFQHIGGGDWNTFLTRYGYDVGIPANSDTCFVSSLVNPNSSGCYFEPIDNSWAPKPCTDTATFGKSLCPIFNFDETAQNSAFYIYSNSVGVKSNFKRQVLMKISDTNPDELDVRVTLEWLNGNLVRTRSLQLSLLNWQN